MEEAIQFGMTYLNYEKIRENQKAVVNSYLEGKDVLFCSPTGSGKSFSFLYHHDALPSLTSSVIVISPLVSLMRSQVVKLKALGLKAAYLTDIGGRGSDEITTRDIVSGQFDILVCSPESVLGEHRDLIKGLSQKNILRAISVDEAHCIVKL